MTNSSKRWQTIDQIVKLMLFRDRKYVEMTDKSETTKTTTTHATIAKNKKRKKPQEHQSKKGDAETEEKRFMAKYSITFPSDWPDKNEQQRSEKQSERTVLVIYLKELDMDKWTTIYEAAAEREKGKHVDDLIVVALDIQPAVQNAIERLSFNKENNLRIECFEGSSLMHDLLNHRMNVQNRPTLLSPTESRKMHRDVFKDAELPVLRSNDVVAKWLGARPHQLVQYDRVSRGVGMSRAYRVVQ